MKCLLALQCYFKAMLLIDFLLHRRAPYHASPYEEQHARKYYETEFSEHYYIVYSAFLITLSAFIQKTIQYILNDGGVY